ncbi:MAG: hypothetical protein J5544_00395 [Clostridia bacterium]|nr:hypothetical protein [Clostridia bacterium]
MKRIVAILLTALIILPLAACKKGGEDPAPTAAPGDSTAAPGETAVPGGDAYVPDLSYNRETDFNKLILTNGNRSSIIETDDVYYWQGDDDPFLRYAEKDGSDLGIVCGKPECVHDNGNINGGNSDCDGSIMPMSFIWLFEGKIYYLSTEYWKTYRNCVGVICRMDPDGTNKEIVKPVPIPEKRYGLGTAVQYVCWHRGLLYLFAHASQIEDAEPSQPFMVYTFSLDGDKPELIYDSGDGFHEGSIFLSGEFCYIEDYIWDYEGYYSDKLLRRSAVTGETELLYEGGEFNWIARYWVDGEGTVYTQEEWSDESGSKAVMRLKNGVWEKAFDFEDPDMSYTIRNLSDGIAIARNFVPFDREYYRKYGENPDIDIWVKRYDGSTVYKGKLPMAWFDEMKAEGMTLEGTDLVCGNENELFCEFRLRKRNPTRQNEPESLVLIKYAFTENGIEEILLGKNYREIKRNW